MSFMDRVRETFSASKEETETEAQRRIVDDQRHLQSIVGIPQARDFAHVESHGDVHKFVAENGSRINVDSNGHFYDGELRPIDREAASTYQRMTTEWQGQSHDDTRQLMDHLKQFTQPAIDQYVQEQKLGGLQNASPAQQDDLGERLQRRLGLAEDSASLAVIQQVMEAKNAHGVRHTPDEEMRQEYAIDTLRGKDGPNYMRESREEDYARKLAEPALEAFAAKNHVAVAQLTQEQVQQVGKEVSQHEQIPLAIATAQVHYAHMQEQSEVRKRDDILEQAVGSTNAGHYTWKQNSGTIESYQHNTTGRFVHLDSDYRFYDQSRSPMESTAALSHAENKPTAAPQNEMTSGRADTERDERAMKYQSTWEGKTDHTLPGGPASVKTETEAPKLQTPELSLSL